MYEVAVIHSHNGKIIVGGGAPSSTNKQVRISSDNGATFSTSIILSSATGYVRKLASTASGRLIAAGNGTAGLVCYSDNDGTSWSFSGYVGTQAVQALLVSPFGVLTGDAAGNIYRSADNGVNFNYVTGIGEGITDLTCRTLE